MYSIDESFIGLNGTTPELVATGRRTLAKLANHSAKKTPALGGRCHFDAYSPAQQDTFMASLPADALWGVAGRTMKRLQAIDIHAVKQLRDAGL